MKLELTEKSASFLSHYATIPIAFEVREKLPIDKVSGVDGLKPVVVEPSYVKDYDAFTGQRPTDWPKRFDLSKWWFAAAYLDGRHVGGVVVVMDTDEEALLWDIRIAPQFRQQGIGRSLLKFAEEHATRRGKLRMKAETQNINIPACRFYADNGYKLRSVNRFAYPELPDEVQLIWSKDLLARALPLS